MAGVGAGGGAVDCTGATEGSAGVSCAASGGGIGTGVIDEIETTGSSVAASDVVPLIETSGTTDSTEAGAFRCAAARCCCSRASSIARWRARRSSSERLPAAALVDGASFKTEGGGGPTDSSGATRFSKKDGAVIGASIRRRLVSTTTVFERP